MEELRHREANNTALQAIGPRKKLKLDTEAAAAAAAVSSVTISMFESSNFHFFRPPQPETPARHPAPKQTHRFVRASNASTCVT
jgi:hypothetical protein